MAKMKRKRVASNKSKGQGRDCGLCIIDEYRWAKSSC